MSLFAPSCPRALSFRQQEIRVLQQTLQIEHDIFQLYDGAAGHLSDANDIEAVTGFAADHHQHIIALRTRLALLGANVAGAGPATRLRGAGHWLMSRMGAELALLGALTRQERLMHEHYRTVDLTPLSRASRALMHHALSDEKGHHCWLEERVAALRPRAVAMPVHVMARHVSAHWAHARSV